MTEVDSKSKIIEMRTVGLDEGSRLEITISKEDIHLDDMAPAWIISKDPKATTLTEVTISGYASKIDDEGKFNLFFAWDKARNRPFNDMGGAGYVVYGNAIREYRIG